MSRFSKKISAVDVLAEAKELATSAGTACRARTAVGRCYYAAFHFLENHPCMGGFDAFKKEFAQRWKNEKLNTHTWRLEYLKRSKLAPVRHAGERLQALLALRIWADYNTLDGPPSPDFLETAVDMAEELLEEILAAYDASLDVRA